MGYYGKEKTSDYFKKNKILEMLSSDQGDFRIFSTPKTISQDTSILIGAATPLDMFKEKNLPSLSVIYRLHDIWGVDVIHLKRVDNLYKVFTGAPSISTTNLLDLYSVKYIVSVTSLGEDPRFRLVYARLEGLQGKKKDLLKENTIKLYRNRNHFPRAWLVKNFRVMDDKGILSRMTSKDFRPDQEVLLEGEPPPFFPLPKGGKGRGKGVEFISESNNRLKLLVRMKEKGFFVLSDTYFPGWKVFVNGKKEKIYRANYNFRAIPLEAGNHEVDFEYKPMSFKLGAVISFLGIIGCLIVSLAARYRGTSSSSVLS
jgi:hypothetical protein